MIFGHICSKTIRQPMEKTNWDTQALQEAVRTKSRLPSETYHQKLDTHIKEPRVVTTFKRGGQHPAGNETMAYFTNAFIYFSNEWRSIFHLGFVQSIFNYFSYFYLNHDYPYRPPHVLIINIFQCFTNFWLM